MFGRLFKKENKEEYRERDVIEITPEMAQQQLIELIRKVLPDNKFFKPEMVVPLIVVVTTLVLSKFNFDKEQVLQTVQETNGQIVTTYNEWAPVVLGVLYAILGGGSLQYASVVSRQKEQTRQEAARSVAGYSDFLKERERTRGLEYQARSLELQNYAKEKEIELQKIMTKADNTVVETNETSDKYGDVSPELKV